MRVLLLDTNQRRPLLHEIFRIPNTNGLSNRLADLERFREQPAVYPNSWLQHWKTPVANMWLIPAGPPPVQATVLAATTNIQELQQLKEWLLGERQMPDGTHPLPLIDLIICDTAPLDEGSDTRGLSTIADGIIMVIEAGKEQKETLDDIRAFHLQTPMLGVVVNRQKAGQIPYYYTHAQHRGNAAAASIVRTSSENQALSEQKHSIHDSSTHAQQTVGELPSVRFAAATGFSLKKIAERPAALLSPYSPRVPLTSASRKLARIDVTTDPLPEANQKVGPELQVARILSGSKTQFKTRPVKDA
jgi:Mrp family chromosome partitioning ATPase